MIRSTNGDPYTTYYASDYNVQNGTYINGTVPGSIQQVDSDYFVVRSSPSATYSSAYNPSGYNLLGSTTLDSGSVSNLTADNGSYMTFQSYASSDNNAFIAYQAGTGLESVVPKQRTWNGSAWSSQGSMPTADSPLRWVRSAYSSLGTRDYEKIVVTIADDEYLDAYVWTGSSWSNASNIGQAAGMSSYRCYDVKYEKTSGNALLVWSTGGGTVDMQYKIWNGSTWSSAYNLDINGTAAGTNIYWIAMAQNPKVGSNELALIATDGTNSDVYGLVWNGTIWGNQQQLDTSVAISTEECIAVAYEQTSGHAVFVWGKNPDNVYSRQWNGTAWDASSTLVDLTGPGRPNWISLKPDPDSDKLMLVAIDGASDLNTADWNGAAWTIHNEHDSSVNTHAARCADVDWEPSGSKALLVWATDTANLSWKTWNGSAWSVQSDFNYAGDEALWVQLRRDPRGIGTAKIFVSASDSNIRGYVVKWNGTALSDSVTFAANLVATTYENFDLAFQNSGEPNEYTVEVEFTGTSNTGTWTQLNWTIDSAWDTANVSVALQLYNYSSGSYPTSGDGYLNYTSSSTANTDENKNQTISSNPEDFKNPSGNWKVKVKGVKTTSTSFKFKGDWIEFKPTYYNEYTVSTEFIFSNMTTKTPTQLNFTIVGHYNIAFVNVTIQVYNYTSASYPTSGEGYLNYLATGTNETKQLNITTNPQSFTLNGNATIRIRGILSTVTQYQQEINQVTLIYSYANSPPVLDPAGNKTVDELSLLDFTVTASDPDVPPQNLTFSLGAGAPPGASITPAGYFTWTPAEDQGPGNYTIRISVSDGSLTDFEDITVTVNEVDSPPVLDPVGDKSVDELSLLNFTATASDSDVPPQNLTFSLGAGAPPGASITPAGYFTWTPAEDQGPGNYTIRISVSDGSLGDYEDMWVAVSQVQLHDVAIVSVTTSSNNVVSGEVVRVTVVVKNQGTELETFDVTVFCNETIMETETVTNLAANDQRNLEFTWDTTGLTEAGYRIRAEASFVSGETETSNNAYTGAVVEVSEGVSSRPFDWVKPLLYILPILFGLLLLIGLKRKRKKKTKPRIEKKTDEFSQQFGITHEQIKGKKMLFEIDPTSDCQKDVSSFVSEAKSNDELLFILTNRNSALHSEFSEDSKVRFLLLTSETSSPLQLNERETLLPANDLSVLLDSFRGIQKVEPEKTINVLFDNLSDVILKCGFKKTCKFMRLLLKSISSSRVTALFVFNPAAHDTKASSSIRDMFQTEAT